ncbi:glycoside hydrolase family 47 protein [Tulasnella calospora MUT 4182]|uniref:Glycoside hydrolase family 47 protein n=1 Tax=Tulasnella calospora MUT 4182 TaxID=1051891 RepID=A0A0C3KG40_9AGAM|nr:glycoside hydrolase family 47 protein [Tulasnella calospora MUT 4182]
MTSETPGCVAVLIPGPSINTILPSELLISVFDVIYLDAIALASIPFPPSHQPPLDCYPLVEVMRVCRIWRRFVEETQSFWTFVVIGISTGGRQLGTKASTRGESGIVRLERILARSGTLPLAVTVALERLVDFPLVVECLDCEVYRLSVLNIIPTYDIPQGCCSHLGNLFERSFPTLKHLIIGNAVVSTYPRRFPLEILVDAPELRSLSCHYHLIFPLSPLLLTSFFLTAIDIDAFEPHLSEGSIHFPRLLDLHLDVSDVGQFLSTFSTPSLQKLTVLEQTSSIVDPGSLSQYPQFEELQWTDTGYDPTLPRLLALCPNLIRFANYLATEESSLNSRFFIVPAKSISLLESNDNIPEVCQDILPKLEKVRLAVATCEEIDTSVKGIPSIKRIRILKNPSKREEEDWRRGAQFLSSLAEKVEVAFGMDPY